MSNIRKTHSASFKLKVALAAIKGDRTMADLCQTYGVHTSQIHKWKNQVEKEGASLFQDKRQKKSSNSAEPSVPQLHEKIGQLTMERDFLSKALSH